MNIVITGASRGIGFGTALALAAHPANQVIAISRNTQGLDMLRSAAQGNINTHAIDLVSCPEEDIAGILAGYGRVDILINNAGQLVNKLFTESTPDDWRQMFDVNLFGALKMIKAALPLMGGSDMAHIVNIGSMGGVQGTSKFAGLSAYSASKAALANLTECLAEELKARNIRVNCLALGAVNTEMLHEAFPGYTAPVSAADMAAFIAHFALTSHQFMNGKILPVSVATP